PNGGLRPQRRASGAARPPPGTKPAIRVVARSAFIPAPRRRQRHGWRVLRWVAGEGGGAPAGRADPRRSASRPRAATWPRRSRIEGHTEPARRAHMAAIEAVGAREILDSRGNPTVEVEVLLEDGTV